MTHLSQNSFVDLKRHLKQARKERGERTYRIDAFIEQFNSIDTLPE